MRLALATSLACPELQADDQPLAGALAGFGVEVSSVPWNAEGVDWTAFDAVVLRSTWDYFHRVTAFRSWLDWLDRQGVRLLNDTATVRWNLHKGYLLDLAAAGIPTLMSRVVAAGDLPSALHAGGPGRVVVKPAEGATAWLTLSGDPVDPAFLQQVRALPADRDFLVQPYYPEICGEGEWSLVYFQGSYSHAVLKRPAAGDFRVQPEFGGTHGVAEPPRELKEAASAILAALESRGLKRPTYARMDGLRRLGRFLLMELELIEPKLFLLEQDGAGAALARGVLGDLGAST